MPRRTAIVFHLTACRRSVQLEQRQLLGDLAADIKRGNAFLPTRDHACTISAGDAALYTGRNE
jgi:hypothetical protein